MDDQQQIRLTQQISDKGHPQPSLSKAARVDFLISNNRMMPCRNDHFTQFLSEVIRIRTGIFQTDKNIGHGITSAISYYWGDHSISASSGYMGR